MHPPLRTFPQTDGLKIEMEFFFAAKKFPFPLPNVPHIGRSFLFLFSLLLFPNGNDILLSRGKFN